MLLDLGPPRQLRVAVLQLLFGVTAEASNYVRVDTTAVAACIVDQVLPMLLLLRVTGAAVGRY